MRHAEHEYWADALYWQDGNGGQEELESCIHGCGKEDLEENPEIYNDLCHELGCQDLIFCLRLEECRFT